MTPQAPRLRSLYRSLLRELPARPLNDPSPIKQRIRTQLSAVEQSGADAAASQLHEASQFLAYVRAQRTYAALLERYNPGMSMTEEDRVRLTMRRVGMELPEEWQGEKKE